MYAVSKSWPQCSVMHLSFLFHYVVLIIKIVNMQQQVLNSTVPVLFAFLSPCRHTQPVKKTGDKLHTLFPANPTYTAQSLLIQWKSVHYIRKRSSKDDSYRGKVVCAITSQFYTLHKLLWVYLLYAHALPHSEEKLITLVLNMEYSPLC